MLKPPTRRTKRLKLEVDEPLSNFAFKFNLRRYNVGNLCPRPKKWKAADYENYGTKSVDTVEDGTYLSGRGYN